MTREPRRHFFNARNEIHYNKEKQMGGPIYIDGMTPEFVRGEYNGKYRVLTEQEIKGYQTVDPVQESIDALNAAIDRLDNIINEMKGQ